MSRGPARSPSLKDSGVHTVRYRVQAGSENRLYRGLPVGEWTQFTVESDCHPNLVTVTPVEAGFTQPTYDNLFGSVTIPTTEGVTYRINGGAVESGVTYPLNPGGSNIMTAEAQEGYVINVDFSQAINIEEAPSFSECTPKPDAVVATTERTVTDCEARTTTTYNVTTTTDWVLAEDGASWVPGATVTAEEMTGTRPATAQECPAAEPTPTGSTKPTPSPTAGTPPKGSRVFPKRGTDPPTTSGSAVVPTGGTALTVAGRRRVSQSLPLDSQQRHCHVRTPPMHRFGGVLTVCWSSAQGNGEWFRPVKPSCSTRRRCARSARQRPRTSPAGSPEAYRLLPGCSASTSRSSWVR